MTVKIALVSDLHLEFADIELPNTHGCDVLILGGDIMVVQDLVDHPAGSANPLVPLGRRQECAERFRNFLSRVSRDYPRVLWVAGNHEFYNGAWPRGLDYMRQETATHGNITVLEDSTTQIGDVVFIGATLWTDMNGGDPITMWETSRGMNDYRIIRNSDEGYSKLRPEHTRQAHRRTVDYIREVVQSDSERRYVVVGHHSPSRQSTKPQYQSEHHINGAYSSNLDLFIMDHPQIVLWTHGHTHHPFDYQIGGTRIVCNPRGYVGYERGPQDVEPYYPQIIVV